MKRYERPRPKLRDLTEAEKRRKAATATRVRDEINLAMQSKRRKSLSVDVSGVDRDVETYLCSIPVVKQWKEEGRKITYRDFNELICHTSLGRSHTASERSKSKSKESAQTVAQSKTLTKWIENKDLPADVRELFEQARTRLCHYAAPVARKFLEEDVPKEPAKYLVPRCLAVSAAAWLLIGLRPDDQRKPPIEISSWHRQETYSAFVRIATALHFNQPVTPQHCREMLKICDKFCELRNREYLGD
jgi:hypothetical protein